MEDGRGRQGKDAKTDAGILLFAANRHPFETRFESVECFFRLVHCDWSLVVATDALSEANAVSAVAGVYAIKYKNDSI
jgi:hypothetical protein